MRINIVDRRSRARSTRTQAYLLYWGFRSLGHQVSVTDDAVDQDALNIFLRPEVFTSPYVAEAAALGQFRYAIISTELFTGNGLNFQPMPPEELVRLEQALRGAIFIGSFYADDLNHYRRLNPHVHYTPYGFCAEAVSITPATEKPIDIYYFGSLLDKHRAVIAALEVQGLKVIAHEDCTQLARDSYLSLAKTSLNLVHPPPFRHISPRVAFCALNSIACLSDRNEDQDRYLDFAVTFETVSALVEGALPLCREGWREAGGKMRAALEQRPFAPLLEQALDSQPLS